MNEEQSIVVKSPLPFALCCDLLPPLS